MQNTPEYDARTAGTTGTHQHTAHSTVNEVRQSSRQRHRSSTEIALVRKGGFAITMDHEYGNNIAKVPIIDAPLSSEMVEKSARRC